MSKVRKRLGAWGEGIARGFLEKQGYRIECSNYRTKQGEIDLICWDNDQMVFVEIKTSRSMLLKTPQEGYSKRQRDRFRLMAENYLATNKLRNKPSGFRFDFVGVKIVQNNHTITHLQNIEIPPF
ncbi:MAG: hypothetical protein A3F16_08175 [Deltaproteobacteria bacterium RIFCSPHIGHO2_12_FULL_43_9]|nr:MAG: hypothetical protein A3F16_08175 [Deltaproteobacteria bacterium RIFCSPHIGHO2_12_FULL_43_9]